MHNCYSARHCFVRGPSCINSCLHNHNNYFGHKLRLLFIVQLAVIDSVRLWMTEDAQLLLC